MGDESNGIIGLSADEYTQSVVRTRMDGKETGREIGFHWSSKHLHPNRIVQLVFFSLLQYSLLYDRNASFRLNKQLQNPFFFPIPFRLTRCVEKRKSTENKFDEIKKKWRKVRGGFMWIFSNPSDTLWYALFFIAFCGRNACSRYRSCENNRIYESHSLLNGRQKSECPAECGVDGSRIT